MGLGTEIAVGRSCRCVTRGWESPRSCYRTFSIYSPKPIKRWIAAAAGHVDLPRGHSLVASYTLALNVSDVQVRTQDASLRLALALPLGLRLTLGVRYLWFRDPLAPWTDASGVVAMASLHGTF